MKKIILVLFSITISLLGIAAPLAITKPDMDAIRKAVIDPQSKYYYPKLMETYLHQADTTMTHDEFRHLYLGYMFQEDYTPYHKNERAKEIEGLYHKDFKELTRSERNQIIQYADSALADNPFDLTQLEYKILALRGNGKNFTADLWEYRLGGIIRAILSTGTGLDKDNAWFVVNPAHEYYLLNTMSKYVSKSNFVEPYFDYVKIKPQKGEEEKAEGYYFNIKTLLEEYYRKNPEPAE